MTPETTNLYRMDDVLIRTGRIGLAIGLFVAITALVAVAGERGASGAAALAWDHGFAFALAMLPPFVALRVGKSIREREERTLAIWKVLRKHVQVSVDELVANSHFSAAELEDTVKLLNTRALGHYVYDRASGLIQDGRLRDVHLHVEKCDVCGGSISLQVPIGFTRVPACPYCGDPVCVDTLDQRRREVLDRLRGESRSKAPGLGGVPFSIPVFVVLLLFCWPAAIGYAWYQTYKARTACA